MPIRWRAALRCLKAERRRSLLFVNVAQTLDPKAEVGLAEKVAFLSTPAAYSGGVTRLARRETHMSWVFFADGYVYKLKKPVRFAYLDFSTLAKREAACRAEVRLNRTLAPGIYLGVAPLTRVDGGLALGGQGSAADWLVVMRRLDEAETLESMLKVGRKPTMGPLIGVLAGFYRRTPVVRRSPAAHVSAWRRMVRENAPVLLDPRLPSPSGRVRAILATQARFLRRRSGDLARRARQGRILDAHGDLRPEHIWMGRPVRIIDRLEFDDRLRAVDPLDEVAALEVELERLGALSESLALRRAFLRRLGDHASAELHLFYRIYRATLRARLSIAHLLEPDPRTPEKWPAQTRAYLAIAARDAARLEALLRRPSGR
jgi:aminoglycoside phosphotransferase family enzyme